MKKFLIKIAIFFLPILLLAYPLDVLLSNFLKSNHSLSYGGDEMAVWNDIYEGAIASEIAIYGSSRAWVQIDPEIFQKELGVTAYNFGLDGHNFHLQYLRNKIYLQKNKKPKVIILSVDLFSVQKRKNLFNYKQFLPYMLWDSTIETYTKSYTGFDYFDYNVPLLRYAGELDLMRSAYHTYSNKEMNETRKNGYAPHDQPWNGDLEKAKETMEAYEVNLHAPSQRLFETFLMETQELGIEVVMVYTPEYIEGQAFVSNREEVIDIYRRYAEEYQISFIDYSADEICFDKKYFYNALHLNKDGAELFSYKLTEELIKLDVLEE